MQVQNSFGGTESLSIDITKQAIFHVPSCFVQQRYGTLSAHTHPQSSCFVAVFVFHTRTALQTRSATVDRRSCRVNDVAFELSMVFSIFGSAVGCVWAGGFPWMLRNDFCERVSSRVSHVGEINFATCSFLLMLYYRCTSHDFSNGFSSPSTFFFSPCLCGQLQVLLYSTQRNSRREKTDCRAPFTPFTLVAIKSKISRCCIYQLHIPVVSCDFCSCCGRENRKLLIKSSHNTS